MRAVFLFLTVLCIGGGVVSGVLAGDLTGMSDIDILVESLDEDARACNVTVDALDAAVRLPLSASRLQVSNDSLSYIYVNVNVLRFSDGLCVASVGVSANTVATPFYSTKHVVGEVWHKGGILSGSSSGFGGRVVDTVEGFSKQFIAAWLKDNAN